MDREADNWDEFEELEQELFDDEEWWLEDEDGEELDFS